jgi:hypothetical protein
MRCIMPLLGDDALLPLAVACAECGDIDVKTWERRIDPTSKWYDPYCPKPFKFPGGRTRYVHSGELRLYIRKLLERARAA